MFEVKWSYIFDYIELLKKIRFNLIKLKVFWIVEIFGLECGYNNLCLCYRRDLDGLIDELNYWLCWGGCSWLLYRIIIVCILF